MLADALMFYFILFYNFFISYFGILFEIASEFVDLPVRSDVKFHEIICPEIFHEIFHEIFQKCYDVFFRLYTHPFNIFYTSNITFHSFMHTAAP